MPLEVPDLDDRSYAELVTEAVSMLPHFAPEWTNHNASDPGITLIELLAYFTELLIYRLNRVSRESRIRFLKLLRHVEDDERDGLADPATPLEDVDEALRRAVLGLRRRQRAVTCEDYEWLVRELTAGNAQGRQIVRARCFTGEDLGSRPGRSRPAECSGQISLVVVPEAELEGDDFTALLKEVRDGLEPMRLLTTRLHVVRPRYVRVSLGAVMRKHPHAAFHDVQAKAIEDLQNYFSPFPGGGPDRDGWPFGRPLYLSEVYERLEGIEGVDSVREVRVLNLSTTDRTRGDERTRFGIQIGVHSTVGVDSCIGGETRAEVDRLVRDARGRLAAVSLMPYELLKIELHGDDFMEKDSWMHAASACSG